MNLITKYLAKVNGTTPEVIEEQIEMDKLIQVMRVKAVRLQIAGIVVNSLLILLHIYLAFWHGKWGNLANIPLNIMCIWMIWVFAFSRWRKR